MTDEQIEAAVAELMRAGLNAPEQVIYRAARAAMEAAERAAWRPIDEAPKDGTHILVAFGPYGPNWGLAQRPPTVVHWFGPPDLPGLRAGGWYLSVNHNDSNKVRQTAWLPLPQPPDNEVSR